MSSCGKNFGGKKCSTKRSYKGRTHGKGCRCKKCKCGKARRTAKRPRKTRSTFSKLFGF